MSDYTPGPWKREGANVYALQHHGWRKGEEQFCNRFFAQVMDSHTPKNELEANARLISAAPELLEACKDVMWSISRKTMYEGSCQCEDCKAIRKVKAAIAKAEGE
jgi:hypothetical protein